MALKNDLLIRAAKGEPVERTPVWLMRQAGRILPEYREVRAKLNGFIDLVKNPERAAEVTIQPVDILNVDAAIIFSDILVIPEALGLPYDMVEKRGPVFPQTISNMEDVKKLSTSDMSDKLGYVIEAIKITKKELNDRVPLIGFAGAPWTIMAYMVEGSGSKTFSKARKMLYTQPETAHALLQAITDCTKSYLKEQVNAGANLVQVFDSWAGILSPAQYDEFAIPYIKQIVDSIEEVPVTVFSKGAYFSLHSLGKMNCETLGLDWNTPVDFALKMAGPNKTFQGNLDPCALYGSTSEVRAETIKMLDQFKGLRHIANLGHGVYPDTDPEKVKVFIETVKNYTQK
ncbi:uroporphyrinogen decarboxylase [Mangrovivirga sp. M17]|uniref:Uroporphyrinogen decarboxylase n=1 Tax=Mangrovivirga halotolerans TaxID=2993936 RepID=A0ABT3RM91_9BACT|nr:uroporphyrinogen decarboxylase [Mangrovivirga halotolerans]MCX2742937.1 uroporphyrinogen decarboxylase [Mangrovivirga halotolerans]